MKLTFLIATDKDLDTLLDFMEKLYAIDNDPFDKEEAKSAVTRLIKDNSLGYLWLIQLDDKPVGYIALTLGYSFEYKGRDAFIDEFFILEEYRNKGIGKRTMEFVVQKAKDLGVNALHLEVEKHNQAGISLYRKFKFKDHQRILMTRWIKD